MASFRRRRPRPGPASIGVARGMKAAWASPIRPQRRLFHQSGQEQASLRFDIRLAHAKRLAENHLYEGWPRRVRGRRRSSEKRASGGGRVREPQQLPGSVSQGSRPGTPTFQVRPSSQLRRLFQTPPRCLDSTRSGVLQAGEQPGGSGTLQARDLRGRSGPISGNAMRPLATDLVPVGGKRGRRGGPSDGHRRSRSGLIRVPG